MSGIPFTPSAVSHSILERLRSASDTVWIRVLPQRGPCPNESADWPKRWFRYGADMVQIWRAPDRPKRRLKLQRTLDGDRYGRFAFRLAAPRPLQHLRRAPRPKRPAAFNSWISKLSLGCAMPPSPVSTALSSPNRRSRVAVVVYSVSQHRIPFTSSVSVNISAVPRGSGPAALHANGEDNGGDNGNDGSLCIGYYVVVRG